MLGLSVRRSAAVAAVVLIGCGVWLIVLMAAHGPGRPQTTSAPAQILDQWQLLRGTPSSGGSPGIAALDRAGEFFAVSPVPFDASVQPVFSLRASGYPLNYVLMLAWKQQGSDEAYFTRLQVPDGGDQHYLMSRKEGWSGMLSELVLYGYPQPQTSPPVTLSEPIDFDYVGYEADSWRGRLAALWTGWVAPDPWAMLSVSSLGKYPDLEEGVGLVPLVAVMVLITCFSLFAIGGLRGQRLGASVIGVVVVGTVLLQWQFTRSLWAQAMETRAQLAHLSPQERRRFQFDQELVDLVDRVKPSIGRDERVHIVTDDRFFNLRAAWHLRPANVSTFYVRGNAQGRFKPGELLFIYRRPDLAEGIISRSMDFGDVRWQVHPLSIGPAGALLRLSNRLP